MSTQWMKYNQRNGALERQVRAARREIGKYTKDDVMLIDKVTYSDNLAETRNNVTEVVEEIDAFIDELEDANDVAKKAKWNTEMRNLLELKANEREVKQARTTLILDNPNDVVAIFRGPAPAPGGAGVEQGEQLPAVGPPGARDAEREQMRLDREMQRDIAKVTQKRIIINEKADEIVSQMKNVSRIDNEEENVGKTFAELMSDDQIRENLRDSTSWKISLMNFPMTKTPC